MKKDEKRIIPTRAVYIQNTKNPFNGRYWLCERALYRRRIANNTHYMFCDEDSLFEFGKSWSNSFKPHVRETLLNKFETVFGKSGYFSNLYLYDNGTIMFSTSGANVPHLQGYLKSNGTITLQSSDDGLVFWEYYGRILFQAVFGHNIGYHVTMSNNNRVVKITKEKE